MWGETWPQTSPDLNPMDRFAWGYLQMEVNSLAPQDLESLKFAIRTCVKKMPLHMVQKAVDGFYKRVCLCLEAGGGHFKHMLGRTGMPLLE